jgi:hypothetical protein
MDFFGENIFKNITSVPASEEARWKKGIFSESTYYVLRREVLLAAIKLFRWSRYITYVILYYVPYMNT